MVSVECECWTCRKESRFKFDGKFRANIPPEVENFIVGEELTPGVGLALSGGVFTCPKGHKNDESCCVADAEGCHAPWGTWEEVK